MQLPPWDLWLHENIKSVFSVTNSLSAEKTLYLFWCCFVDVFSLPCGVKTMIWVSLLFGLSDRQIQLVHNTILLFEHSHSIIVCLYDCCRLVSEKQGGYAKEVVVLPVLVCLSVSKQHNSKSYSRILTKFSGWLGNGTRNKWLLSKGHFHCLGKFCALICWKSLWTLSH